MPLLFSFYLKFFLLAAKQQWQKTSKQLLESKKPFGLDITPLQPSPSDEKKIVEIAMKFAFQIDSITLNLFTGKIYKAEISIIF
jgi:hypothetical protein